MEDFSTDESSDQSSIKTTSSENVEDDLVNKLNVSDRKKKLSMKKKSSKSNFDEF